MKKRWIRKVLAWLGLVGLVFLLTNHWRPWEPHYRLRPLSYWVDQCIPSGSQASSMWLEEPPSPPEPVLVSIRAIGPKAVSVLLKEIRKTPLYTRLYLNLPIEFQCIVPRVDTPDWLHRNRVVSALRLIGPAALPSLQQFLKDPSSEVRLVAARTLGVMGVEADPAAAAIAQLLKDPESAVRMAALGALRQMGPNKRGAIAALVEALQDDDNHADVLEDAAKVLASIGPDARTAVVELNDLLMEPGGEPRVREQAAIALWRINQDTNAFSFLLQKLESCRTNWHLGPAASPRWSLGPVAGGRGRNSRDRIRRG